MHQCSVAAVQPFSDVWIVVKADDIHSLDHACVDDSLIRSNSADTTTPPPTKSTTQTTHTTVPTTTQTQISTTQMTTPTTQSTHITTPTTTRTTPTTTSTPRTTTRTPARTSKRTITRTTTQTALFTTPTTHTITPTTRTKNQNSHTTTSTTPTTTLATTTTTLTTTTTTPKITIAKQTCNGNVSEFSETLIYKFISISSSKSRINLCLRSIWLSVETLLNTIVPLPEGYQLEISDSQHNYTTAKQVNDILFANKDSTMKYSEKEDIVIAAKDRPISLYAVKYTG